MSCVPRVCTDNDECVLGLGCVYYPALLIICLPPLPKSTHTITYILSYSNSNAKTPNPPKTLNPLPQTTPCLFSLHAVPSQLHLARYFPSRLGAGEVYTASSDDDPGCWCRCCRWKVVWAVWERKDYLSNLIDGVGEQRRRQATYARRLQCGVVWYGCSERSGLQHFAEERRQDNLRSRTRIPWL